MILTILLSLATTTTARTTYYQPLAYTAYTQPTHLYYVPHVLPYFRLQVSKPLEKHDVVVALNDEDIADILEIPADNELECLEEGSFPHPEYCDKYFTCTDQSGVLKMKEMTCMPGELYNPLLLVCEKEEEQLGKIWISSSVEVTCSRTSQDLLTEQFCHNPGLTELQREMCEKNHWKHSDHF